MNHLKKWQQSNGLTPDGIVGPNTLAKMSEIFGISNKNRLAHFVGQMAHESQNFTRTHENLNYSYERLLQIFSYDLDQDRNGVLSATEKQVALKLARQPELIANFVYANQGGNGDEHSGDGWKFRGRGPLQLTLRDNYERFSRYVGDPCIMEDPDLVIEKYYFESALWFFSKNNLWPICDQVNDTQVTILTRRINGGRNGLNDRIYHTKKLHRILLS